MLFKKCHLYLAYIVLAPAIFSCQKNWYPAAQLPPETDLKIGKTIPKDSIADATIAPYRKQVNQRMNEVIGQATTEMRGRGAGIETTLGNFVADLQREQASALSGKAVDMGLINTGALRTIIPKGNIKLGDIFELMPFENELLVLTLPGTAIQKMFQFAAVKKNVSLSNTSYIIKENQATNILIGGKPLDTQHSYTLAVSDYLANGGDNMVFLQEAIKTDKVGILIRDAIIKQIKQLTAQNRPVEARIEGRVKVL